MSLTWQQRPPSMNSHWPMGCQLKIRVNGSFCDIQSVHQRAEIIIVNVSDPYFTEMVYCVHTLPHHTHLVFKISFINVTISILHISHIH